MKRLPLGWGVAAVAVLTLVGGVIQGRMSNRWGPTADTLAVAQELEKLPSQFGKWQLQSSEEMPPDTLEMLECAGYVLRKYVNQASGDTVSMTVIVGPPGPTAVHTPEICFSSRAYEIRSPRQRVTMRDAKGADNTFWALTFRSNDMRANVLSVYYAWSLGDRWQAADDPRFALSGYPYLYKIQLASHAPAGAHSQVADPCYLFLQEFMPAARPYLVDCTTE